MISSRTRAVDIKSSNFRKFSKFPTLGRARAPCHHPRRLCVFHSLLVHMLNILHFLLLSDPLATFWIVLNDMSQIILPLTLLLLHCSSYIAPLTLLQTHSRIICYRMNYSTILTICVRFFSLKQLSLRHSTE